MRNHKLLPLLFAGVLLAALWGVSLADDSSVRGFGNAESAESIGTGSMPAIDSGNSPSVESKEPVEQPSSEMESDSHESLGTGTLKDYKDSAPVTIAPRGIDPREGLDGP